VREEAVKREQDALEKLEQIRRGGDPKYHEKARGEGKLFCRERLALCSTRARSSRTPRSRTASQAIFPRTAW
jgi:acetyl-CoA carboxylase carboxyltransferase component